MVKRVKQILVILLLLLVVTQVFTDEGGDAPSFGASMGLGVETIDGEAWQLLNFCPDLGNEKFGVGIDLTLHYTFTGGETGTEFEVSPIDWSPAAADKSFIELYLPKIRYIRWGLKGAPLYVKFGGIDDGTLGNGFIFGNYANTLFIPEDKILGVAFDLSGDLFNFPYFGFETLVANVAAPDVLGFRGFIRPIKMLDIPVLSNLEFGATMGMDLNVYSWDEDPPEEAASIAVSGIDFRLPVLGSKLLSMALFGDLARIDVEGSPSGGMVGFGGKILGFLTYGAQLRMVGENFSPVYFNQSYDVAKAGKYDALMAALDDPIEGFLGAFASAGTSFMDDKIRFLAYVDFPLEEVVVDTPENPHPLNYPHLHGKFIISEGILPGFSADASYDKQFISTFADLVDPFGAIIKARINYGSGPAMISMVYNLRYDPDPTLDTPWVVTSGLESSLQLF
jgi:hypothetical protein